MTDEIIRMTITVKVMVSLWFPYIVMLFDLELINQIVRKEAGSECRS